MGYANGIIFACLLIQMLIAAKGVKWNEEKFYHLPKNLTEDEMRHLATINSSDFENILDTFLIPRMVGTDNHTIVREHITEFLQGFGWQVEYDEFEDETPYGRINFTNIISTFDPEAPRRLVFACHYDSKNMSVYEFVGAIDSAVSCSMLLHLVKSLDGIISNSAITNVSLQLIFFDGEEAFYSWTALDSLYGSRHLAAEWANMSFPPGNPENTSYLDRMDMLVLLDLIGMDGLEIRSNFKETYDWHIQKQGIEQWLRHSSHWSGDAEASGPYFKNLNGTSADDDHLPFWRRGVRIMHDIPGSAPWVWHTPFDRKDALDFSTIHNLLSIYRIFIAAYLHLEISTIAS